MKRFIVLLVAAMLVSSCAYRHQPVYDVNKPLPQAAQSLPLNEIERLIVAGGTFYQCQFQRAGDGHLVATQSQPKYSAIVDIYFTNLNYKITKQSTVGLADQGATIHSHYNVWIRNLEKSIDAQLANRPLTQQ